MFNPKMFDDMSWRMAEVYGACVDRLLVNIAHYFPYIHEGQEPKGTFQYMVQMLANMGQVNRDSLRIIEQSLHGEDEALRGMLMSSIRDVIMDIDPPMRKAAEQGLFGRVAPPVLDPSTTQAFQMYYKQSADKLNLVNTVMLESTQHAYQNTVADIVQRVNAAQGSINVAAGEVIVGAETWNRAMNQAVFAMAQQGLTGFVDHAGRHWTPEAYVAMDIRTTVSNTARATVFEQNEAYGNDMYSVSTHDGARPLCYPWQGKVISRTDSVRDVTDLHGNTLHVYAQSETSYGEPAGLFGINCGHYPTPFFPGLSMVRGEPQDPEENEKTYQESQEQRRLERELRTAKRDLAVEKARGAPDEVIREKKAKVDAARGKLDDFCEKTGRNRRSAREGTPINARFPDKGSYTVGDMPQTVRNQMREFYQQQAGKNVASQATQIPQRQSTIRGKTNKLEGALSAQDYDEVVRMVDASPTKPLYETYGDSCSGIMLESSGGVYRSYVDEVHFPLETHDGMNRYATMAHEMGHMFDHHIGRGNGLTFGEVDFLNSRCVIGSGVHKLLEVVPSQSDQFLTAMRADRKQLAELLKNPEAIKRMRTGAWCNSTSGVQDAMDGFFGTQDKGILPWGHGNRYYNRVWNRRVSGFGLESDVRDAMRDYGLGVRNLTQAKQLMRDYETASELWANVISALTCGGEELKAFEEYMPNVVQAARDIIGGL
jgi:hypothetical protein